MCQSRVIIGCSTVRLIMELQRLVSGAQYVSGARYIVGIGTQVHVAAADEAHALDTQTEGSTPQMYVNTWPHGCTRSLEHELFQARSPMGAHHVSIMTNDHPQGLHSG